MNKKIFAVVLTIFVILIGSRTFAATCPNIMGDYDFGFDYVACDSGNCGFGSAGGIMRVTGQNGCLFYGYTEWPDQYQCPFTGAISGKAVTGTDCDNVLINGALLNYNSATHLYDRMKFTLTETSDPGLQFTGVGTATRR